MSDDADLLFYGCDLASTAEGEQLIQAIASLTGADVAASDDLTGHLDLAGDWQLAMMFTFSLDENAVVGPFPEPMLLAADPDLRYSAETGKFYKVSGDTGLWSAAKTAAESTALNGVNGQLATIRSAYENQYLTDLMNDTIGFSAWIGAIDSNVEGEWRWVDGGVEADQFWQGDENGYGLTGTNNNFEAGQPNDVGNNEDVAHLQTDGTWRDADHDNHNFYGYIVEWDADEVLDATQALTYANQSQTVAGAFEVDSSTGQIRVADGSLRDYETSPTHTLTIRTTDVDGNTYDEAFTISLNDLVEANNAPTDLSSGIELNTDGGNDAYLINTNGDAYLGWRLFVHLRRAILVRLTRCQ